MEGRESIPQESSGGPADTTAADASQLTLTEATILVSRYFAAKSPEYAELVLLRKLGWESEEGDEEFRKQKETSLKRTTPNQSKFFFHFNKVIARNIDDNTQIFRSITQRSTSPRILDLCCAPGGFAAHILQTIRGAQIRGITLPVTQEGHKMVYKNKDNLQVRNLDITMLISEMSPQEFPETHPELEAFVTEQPFPNRVFDLAICDGNVVTQHCLEYRAKHETMLLQTSQLVVALRRLKTGGSLLISCNRLDLWNSVALVRTLSQFAAIRLFKATNGKPDRGIFFIIADNVQSRSEAALGAIEEWRTVWKGIMFGTQERVCVSRAAVDDLLSSMGDWIAGLGRDVWRVQVEGLRAKKYIKRELERRRRSVDNGGAEMEHGLTSPVSLDG